MTRRNLVLVLVSGAALAALFFLLRPVLAPTGPQEITLALAVPEEGEEPVRLETSEGDTLTLLITSLEAGELHLHGYDLEVGVAPGQETPLTFIANLVGHFEMELHLAGEKHEEGSGESAAGETHEEEDSHDESGEEERVIGVLEVLPR